jgi:hypothetical protein
MAANTPDSNVSPSDILTTLKNVVLALNGATTAYRQVNGISTKEGITVPTVVKTTPGRVASVSIIVAGSTTGMLYDANQLGITLAPLWVIPEAAKTDGQPYVVNQATDTGILVVPGTGQSVTVCWS